MSAIPAVITAKRSGIYRAPAQVEELQKAAGKAGLAWMALPLQAVANKKQFLAVCAKQMKLPSYFGGNWDALADCVRDFNWLSGKGYVLHMAGHEKFAKAAAGDYQTALDVLSEAAKFWKGKGTPFIVLVDGAKDLPAY
ncbi:MAG: barstar family protein [Burkholderiales bacterium]